MATARARKREAVAELRSLAVDRGLAVNRRSADLSAAAFEALAAAVLAAGGVAEQVAACSRHFAEAAPPEAGAVAGEPAAIADGDAAAQAAEGALADGGEAAAIVAEPAAAPDAAPAPAGADVLALLPGAFRLRCSAALFTYNSGAFGERDLDQLWASVVAFVRSLPFVERWTCTIERSLKSDDFGRHHIHIFFESVLQLIGQRSTQWVSRGRGPTRAPPVPEGPTSGW